MRQAPQFKHINSCVAWEGKLICAASNYPEVPMASRIEFFDADSLRHVETRILGPGYGSLTWVDWHDRGWWACFANCDGKGGEPGRDHRETMLVRYDRAFREQARWRLPMRCWIAWPPQRVGRGLGADGLLYVTGHDRPEMYALSVPPGGGMPTLVATIATPTDGQAIGWDSREPRLLWSIDRRTSEMVASHVPPVGEGGR